MNYYFYRNIQPKPVSSCAFCSNSLSPNPRFEEGGPREEWNYPNTPYRTTSIGDVGEARSGSKVKLGKKDNDYTSIPIHPPLPVFFGV